MSAYQIWLAIIGLAIVTFISRGLFLLFGNRIELSETLIKALRFAPAAALVAIIAPEILLTHDHFFNWTSPNLWGGIGAILAFLLTRSLVGTIVVGMMVFTLIRWWIW